MDELQQMVVEYVKARNWEQFHNPKDLAISLTLEAAEVLEHFQWKGPDEIETYIKTNKSDIAEELCDVLYWVLLMCHYLKIDIPEAFNLKMAQNNQKYPVDKAKGRKDKYTAYQGAKQRGRG